MEERRNTGFQRHRSRAKRHPNSRKRGQHNQASQCSRRMWLLGLNMALHPSLPRKIDAFRTYITKRMTMPFFSNARTVRNSIDLARMRAAIRLFNEKMSPSSDGTITEAELQTITASDFPSLAELEAQGDEAIVA